MRARVLVIVLALALLPASLAGAQTLEDLWAPQLEAGDWSGQGAVQASGTASVEGFDLTFNADLTLDFKIGVSLTDDIAGTYDLRGPWAMSGKGQVDGHAFEFTADMTMSGAGTGEGTVKSPILTRTASRSEGTVAFKVDGGAANSFPQENPDDYDPILLEITGATCNEAYGRWTVSWRQQLVELGWAPTVEGTWTALNKAAFPGVNPEQLEVVAGLVRQWQTLRPIELLQQGFPQVLDYLTQGEELLNLLRNVSTCGAAEHDQIRKWMTWVTNDIYSTIERATGQFDLSSASIGRLLSIGIRTAALGAGAVDQVSAGRAMAFLEAEALQILSSAFEPTGTGECYVVVRPGCLRDSLQVQGVLAVGSQVEWSYSGLEFFTILDVGVSTR